MTERKRTRQIDVGGVPVGGGAPVAVQSMTKTQTRDAESTVAQVKELEAAGCELIRVAVPDSRSLRALPEIQQRISIPLIADIHFRPELALGALDSGADCVRVNPGNLGGVGEFETVARKAAALGKAVRIGVNSGSLEDDIAGKAGLSQSEKFVKSALRYVEAAGRLGLENIKVSLKGFDVPATVQACELFSEQCDAPLHIGITEAGDEFSGAVRSAVGLGILLARGIGDTIRVSLTADPVKEVEAAWEILGSLNIRRRGIEIVSCPTCGRCEADVAKIAAEIKARVKLIESPLRIAVMGCEVNGPGEAASADAGVALDRKGGGTLFVQGVKTRKLAPGSLPDELYATVLKLASDSSGNNQQQ